MNWRNPLFLVALALISSCRTPEEPSPPLPPSPPPAPPVVEEPEPEEVPPMERLRVGMTKEEVLHLLPEPEEIDLASPGYEVWSYPDHQLHFKEELLYDWFYIENGKR